MDSITKNILDKKTKGMRLLAAPTKAKDVVTLQGSVVGGWNMLPAAKGEVPNLFVELLDAGTKKKGKDAIRESLAARGVLLDFTAGGDRLYFSGSCLPEDLSFTLSLITEMLSEASFPASELASAKARELGDLQEGKTDTRVQASIALSRMLYDPKHANYANTTAERITQTKAVSRTDLVAFQKQLGRNGLVLALVGDIDAAKALTLAEKAFAKLPEGTFAVTPKKANTKAAKKEEKLTIIKDKANVDVYLGASIPLKRSDALYQPFLALAGMLAGRGLSIGHLMRTIRERDGLTYGIYALPTGFGDGADGSFRIWATFSPANYKKALAKTLAEIQIFLKTGITEEMLAMKKSQTTGAYQVGLSTTNGLANALHSIAEEGKELSYLDEFPELIRTITLDDVRAAAALVPFDSLSVSAAGSLD